MIFSLCVQVGLFPPWNFIHFLHRKHTYVRLLAFLSFYMYKKPTGLISVKVRYGSYQIKNFGKTRSNSVGIVESALKKRIKGLSATKNIQNPTIRTLARLKIRMGWELGGNHSMWWPVSWPAMLRMTCFLTRHPPSFWIILVY